MTEKNPPNFHIRDYVDISSLRKALIGKQALNKTLNNEPYQIIGVTDDLKVERVYLYDHTQMFETADLSSVLNDTEIPDSERIPAPKH